MNTAYQIRPISVVKHAGWWAFFLVCVFYTIYALALGVTEMLHLLGIVDDARSRAAPLLFVVHALSGSVALISGPLQFNRLLRNKNRNLHRVIGRLYVWAIWLASVGGLWSALFFNVNIAAKLAFGTLAILWFSTTTVAYLHIRQRKIREHREWMIRSFALSFFFVTFSFWTPGLASTSLPQAAAYPCNTWLRSCHAAVVFRAVLMALDHQRGESGESKRAAAILVTSGVAKGPWLVGLRSFDAPRRAGSVRQSTKQGSRSPGIGIHRGEERSRPPHKREKQTACIDRAQSALSLHRQRDT
jgi:uncharacterized membrane protein